MPKRKATSRPKVKNKDRKRQIVMAMLSLQEELEELKQKELKKATKAPVNKPTHPSKFGFFVVPQNIRVVGGGVTYAPRHDSDD